MNCLSPINILNPSKRHIFEDFKYTYGNSSLAYDAFVRRFGDDSIVTVPCGKCESCLTRKANEWSFRLFNEWKHSDNCVFVTLTYHDGALPMMNDETPCFNRKDCQNFIKRLRNKFGAGIRYFLVSEYGGEFGRPHYHALIFNIPRDESNPHWLTELEYDIFNAWNKGQVKVDDCKSERIIYCSKYCLSSLDWSEDFNNVVNRKIFKPSDKRTLKNFILSSRKPGIGTQFLDDNTIDYYRNTLDTCCKTPNGISYPMARFYKDKIFDDEMKAEILDRLKSEWKEPTNAEKEAYKYRIRKNFKKSHKL